MVVHLPMAAAAARASSAAAAAAAASSAAASARTSTAASSNKAHAAAASASSPAGQIVTNAFQNEDSWQANYLASWQQVTVDAVEGLKPWLWQLLCFCGLKAAAGLPLHSCTELQLAAAAADGSSLVQDDSAAGNNFAAESVLAAAAVAALPLQQMMQESLLQALCALPYPNSAQAAGRVNSIAQQLLLPSSFCFTNSGWSGFLQQHDVVGISRRS
jgi:hypothetical protein